MEAAFFQHPNRCGVVIRDMGNQRPDMYFTDKQSEGTGRHALTPELATDPVADVCLVINPEAVDITDHNAPALDRASNDRGVIQYPCPVQIEICAVPRVHLGKIVGLGVLLMAEEHIQV